MPSIGIGAIGRNESPRLRQCLESLIGRGYPVVYVDSGSTDGSPDLARSIGVEVVELDRATPFTAARARNAGLHRLLELGGPLEFVQFVDGDCEVVADWLERASEVLQRRPDVAVVYGRRRERFPAASIYNRLCDMEWNTPVGEAKSCGGDAMMRTQAVLDMGGYNPALIAGEEPDLCLRLRENGWSILRLDAEMTLHDAAMTRFSQWWRRTVRNGYRYAEGAWRYRRSPSHHDRRQFLSVVAWGIVLPLAVLCALWVTRGFSAALLLAYPLLWLRVRRHRRRRRGDTPADASLYATFCVLGKFAEAAGAARYVWRRLRGSQIGLIEYKGPPAAPAHAELHA